MINKIIELILVAVFSFLVFTGFDYFITALNTYVEGTCSWEDNWANNFDIKSNLIITIISTTFYYISDKFFTIRKYLSNKYISIIAYILLAAVLLGAMFIPNCI